MTPPTAPPTITPGLASVVVTEGNAAVLTCTAIGDPIPIQTWSRNGNRLTSGARYQISGSGSVLTVQQVTESQDEGVFTCHASNEAGNDTTAITLSVQGRCYTAGKIGEVYIKTHHNFFIVWQYPTDLPILNFFHPSVQYPTTIFQY